MSDEKNFSLVNLKLPPSVDNAVKNVSDYPTKNIGQTVGDIWFLVFGGITQSAEKRKLKYAVDLKKFEEELYAKIDLIPVDRRIEPDMQVVAPSLEAAKYCVEHEELRKMFVNLIASSMNTDTAHNAHPSFAYIIKQMSPIDAENFILFEKSILPIVDYNCYSNKSKSTATIIKNVFLENPKRTDLFQQSISISVLQQLGLISTIYDHYLINDTLYKPFYEAEFYNSTKTNFNNDPKNIRLDVHKEYAKITNFGVLFRNVCCSK
jgi:hypothetical protein